MVRRRWWCSCEPRTVAVVQLVVLVLVGCEVVTPLDPSLGAAVLTSVGQDTNGLAVDGGTVVVSAPATNQGATTRLAFWRLADQVGPDQQTCATWSDAGAAPSFGAGGEQEGAALRISTVADDRSPTGTRTRAITVTKNVWLADYATFNVHVWDTLQVGDEWTFVAAFDLSGTFGSHGAGEPFPWRLCARVVGQVLSFLVWPARLPEPAWGDPAFGGQVALPVGAPRNGAAGFYVGHVQPGAVVAFSDLVVGSVPADAASTSVVSASAAPRHEGGVEGRGPAEPPTTVSRPG